MYSVFHTIIDASLEVEGEFGNFKLATSNLNKENFDFEFNKTEKFF